MRPQKTETLPAQKPPRPWAVLAACFALPAVLMTLVFLLSGICPFGSRSLGVIDMSHQYMAFLAYFRELVTGGGDLAYLPNLCLGCSLPAALAYYITSPLNLLFCLFKTKDMLTAVSLVYILRVGLCGLTMGLYVGKRHGWRFAPALLCGMAYAFMGYMIAYSFNFLWQDCVILLPVLALGIHRLVNAQKPWLYGIVLAACIMMSYYIGFMLCIFAVLWFVYELICAPGPRRIGRTLGCFVLSSLAAGALSAIILLPQLLAVGGGKAEFSLSVLTLEPNFDLLALGSKLYTGAFRYEEIMPQGLPNIFCGMAVLALAALFFFNRRIPARRRIASGAFLAVMVLSFWIRGLDLIWHCLNEPDWFNARYSFIFNFFLAALACEELCSFRDGHENWHFAMPVALLGLITAGAFLGKSYAYVTLDTAFLCIGVTAALCGLLFVMSRPGITKRLGAVLMAVFIVIHCAELAANAVLDFQTLTSPEHAADAADYKAYAAAKDEALALLPQTDEALRTESTTMFDLDRCEALLFGYNGISGYSSTIPKMNLDFLKSLGYSWYDDQWALYGTGVTAAADTLLGVRYVLAGEGERPYSVYARTDSYVIYENEYALPMAYAVAGAVTQELAADDCFAVLQAIYSAASPETGKELFIPARVDETSVENAQQVSSDGAVTYTPEGLGSVTWALTVQADGPLYAQWRSDDYPGVMVFVDGVMLQYHLTTQSNGSVHLGDFEAGQTVTVKLQFGAAVTLCGVSFCTEDLSALAAYSEDLARGGCPLTQLSSSHYTGTFTAAEGDEYLLVTMPCDGGWTVWVDGVKTEPVRVFGCLTAIPVSAGGHTVELRYTPAGFIAGAVISGGVFCACIAAALLRRKKRGSAP